MNVIHYNQCIQTLFLSEANRKPNFQNYKTVEYFDFNGLSKSLDEYMIGIINKSHTSTNAINQISAISISKGIIFTYSSTKSASYFPNRADYTICNFVISRMFTNCPVDNGLHSNSN